MRVLVGCEHSGVVRRAFRARGHEAISCDLLPADDASPFHYQGDVLDIVDQPWDLAVFHPPCTYLCGSGVRWLTQVPANPKPGVLYGPPRQAAQREALDFVRTLLGLPIPRIALENPISVISSRIRKPDQIVQPWQFGHGETKATCFWLRNLPPLVPTNVVEGRENRVHRMSPGAERGRLRSISYPGMAAAMADQWGGEPVEVAS